MIHSQERVIHSPPSRGPAVGLRRPAVGADRRLLHGRGRVQRGGAWGEGSELRHPDDVEV